MVTRYCCPDSVCMCPNYAAWWSSGVSEREESRIIFSALSPDIGMGPADYADFKKQRMVAACKPYALISLGTHAAILMHSLAAKQWQDLALNLLLTLTSHLGTVSLYSSGNIDLLAPAYITGHVLSSLIVVGMSLTPSFRSEAFLRLVASKREVIADLLGSYQPQMSLPFMTVLHGLRVVAYMMVDVNVLGGKVGSGTFRWLGDWAVLMAVQCVYEATSWALYVRSRKAARRQQAKRMQGAVVASSSAKRADLLPGSAHTVVAQDVGYTGPGDTAAACNKNADAAEGFPGDAGRAETHATTVVSVAQGTTGLATPLTVTRALPVNKYKSRTKRLSTSVHIKLQDLTAEQVPKKLPDVLQHQLASRLGAVSLAGVAVRRGCVLLSMDLVVPEGGEGHRQLASAHTLVELINAIAKPLTALQPPGSGSPAVAQVADMVVGCAWDPSRQEFTSGGADAGGVARALSFSRLYQLAAQCRALAVVPAVHCVGVGAVQSVQLTLQLQLPVGCRLLGWMPDGPAHATLDANPDGVEATVVVRYARGRYMPVSALVMSEEGAPRDLRRIVVNVKATLTEDITPVGLQLEVWLKGLSDTVPEATPVLAEIACMTCPLVVLPAERDSVLAELSAEGLSHLPMHHLLTEAGTDPTDDSFELLEDLGVWLTHHTGLCAAPTGGIGSGGTMQCVGDELLLNLVSNGMVDTAQLMVSVLNSSLGSGSAGDGSKTTSMSSLETEDWFERVARPEGDMAGKGGLLHAAMSSGRPAMLERVLRWGRRYGGLYWRWPLSLPDASGNTALHVAAEHPDPAVCTSLLETLLRMLSPADVAAAHDIWRHSTGASQEAPAQWFARCHPGVDTSSVWRSAGNSVFDAVCTALASDDTDKDNVGAGSSDEAAGLPGTAAARRAGAVRHAEGASNGRGKRESLLQVLRQSWQWTPAPAYNRWASKQLSGTVAFWAHSLNIIGVIVLLKSLLEGSLENEAVFISLHTSPYIFIAATFLLQRPWLGNWQAWMPLVPVCHSLAYLYQSMLPPERMHAYAATTSTGVDFIYMAVLIPVIEQNTMPYMALSRLMLALCHGHAFHSIGDPHPYLRALKVHAVAILVNAVVRVWQWRAFHRWEQGQKERMTKHVGAKINTEPTSHTSTAVEVDASTHTSDARTASNSKLKTQ